MEAVRKVRSGSCPGLSAAAPPLRRVGPAPRVTRTRCSAAAQGAACVGIRAANSVVIAVERRSTLKLQVSIAARARARVALHGADNLSAPRRPQDPRTVRKIHQLDEHVMIACAGLNADARVLINKVGGGGHRAGVRGAAHAASRPASSAKATASRWRTRPRWSTWRATSPRCSSATRSAAGCGPSASPPSLAAWTLMAPRTSSPPTRRAFTSRGRSACARPARLERPAPDTSLGSRLQANATGRNDKSLREFLEKHYEDGMDTDSAIKLAVKTLLEVRSAAAWRCGTAPLPSPSHAPRCRWSILGRRTLTSWSSTRTRALTGYAPRLPPVARRRLAHLRRAADAHRGGGHPAGGPDRGGVCRGEEGGVGPPLPSCASSQLLEAQRRVLEALP